MRIEELQNGNYIRTPDKSEHEVINVVNRFFNSDMEDFDKSKESIILEVQRRLKPLIINMVKRIAWEQGKDIFEPMINEIVDKVMSEEVVSLKELINSIKTNMIKNRTFSFTATNSTTFEVEIPQMYEVTYGMDVIKVKVNGMEQVEAEHYNVFVDGKRAKKIIFMDTLEKDDVVSVEFWVYTDTNTTPGGTP